MNRQELRTYVKNRYRTEMADTQLNNHIDEVYMDLARLFTPDTTKETTATTVLAQSLYVLSVDSRRIKDVHYDVGAYRTPLTRCSPDSIVYPIDSGIPARWYPYGMNVSTAAVRQQFGVDPAPNSAAATKTLTIMYEPEPTSLSSDASTPEYVPEEYHYLIAYYVLAMCAAHAKDYNAAQVWEGRYLRAFNELAAKLGSTAKSNFPQIAEVLEQ